MPKKTLNIPKVEEFSWQKKTDLGRKGGGENRGEGLKVETNSGQRWKDFHVKEFSLPAKRPKRGSLVGAFLAEEEGV